jgi:phosphatidate cytidylyltransferase
MKELLVRGMTGTGFVGVVLWGIYGRYEGWYLIFGAIAGGLVWEMLGLWGKHGKWERVIEGIVGAYVFTAVYGWKEWGWGWEAWAPYAVFLVWVGVREVWGKEKKWLESVTAQVYCAGSMALLNLLEGRWEAGVLLGLVWMNDTTAYLTGSRLGKHKFCKKVSPKKTWEGLIGGLTGVIVLGQALGRYGGDMGRMEWVGLSVVMAIGATAGDLLESRLKRRAGVKDSGQLLPGHGGLLDRMDSSMVCIPVGYVYLEAVRCWG